MAKWDPVEIDYVSLVHETDAAWLIEFSEAEKWIPKSQIDLDEDDLIVTMPEWLAFEKGLI